MTKTEYQWCVRAIRMLDRNEVSKVQEAKILRTIAQIFESAAVVAEARLWQDYNTALSNNNPAD